MLQPRRALYSAGDGKGGGGGQSLRPRLRLSRTCRVAVDTIQMFASAPEPLPFPLLPYSSCLMTSVRSHINGEAIDGTFSIVNIHIWTAVWPPLTMPLATQVVWQRNKPSMMTLDRQINSAFSRWSQGVDWGDVIEVTTTMPFLWKHTTTSGSNQVGPQHGRSHRISDLFGWAAVKAAADLSTKQRSTSWTLHPDSDWANCSKPQRTLF